MKKKTLKIISSAIVAAGLGFVTLSGFAAAPWSPVQQHRADRVHNLNHRQHHQERAAQRAWRNGNLYGYFKHQQRANELHARKHHVKHVMNRSNRRWERNHVHCPYGVC